MGDSGVTPDSLTEALKSKMNIQHISIEDMSGGCGQAFNAIIVSPDFEKKSLLQRHRMVNAALKAEIAAIHAWTPKCLTPEQWEKGNQGECRLEDVVASHCSECALDPTHGLPTCIKHASSADSKPSRDTVSWGHSTIPSSDFASA